MPFKSDKQRKWMWANNPEMAKKWEKEEVIREKLRHVIRQEIKSVNEADLGLTYKKGKTVKVKHKKSGKELVIVDKPNVKKEYEKIGYFAESVNEGRLNSKIKKAILIAIEMSGNMTGATKKIEKIKKGLSNNKKVQDALRLANESVNELKKMTPIQKIEKLAKANKYGEVDGMRLNGKTANTIMKVYNHPKIKQFHRKLDSFKSHEIIDVLLNLTKVLGIKEDRDYKAEYKKYGSSTKSKKYRAELNQYNRKKGTYGNNDGKDASHKGGKIMGFEKESTNRGRAEKSRLKKEAILKLKQMIREELYNTQGEQTDFKKGDLVKDINPDCPHVGSVGGVIKVGKGTITFKVTNNGKTYHAGDELEKTVDQMVKLSQTPFADDHEETEKQPMSESVNEARSTNREWNKFEKAFGDFFTTVLRLGKANTKVTGDKTDEKIFIKNFNRDVGKFYSLMQSWVRGQNESVNEGNFDRGTSGLPKGFTDDYYKIVKKLSKGKGYLTLSKSDKKKVWTTLGKIYTESVNEGSFKSTLYPKKGRNDKIRFQNDPSRLYKLKNISVGNKIKGDPSGTSYMFVAPGNRKEYFTKQTWRQAMEKGWLSLESVNEKISKEEWAEYPKYARKLKPYMKRLLKIPIKVRVIKQANHNPWIEVRVARFGKDVIPNDFRKRALKVTGGGRPRDMDNIHYGNITAGSVSMKHDQWVKLLGNKVK